MSSLAFTLVVAVSHGPEEIPRVSLEPPPKNVVSAKELNCSAGLVKNVVSAKELNCSAGLVFGPMKEVANAWLAPPARPRPFCQSSVVLPKGMYVYPPGHVVPVGVATAAPEVLTLKQMAESVVAFDSTG